MFNSFKHEWWVYHCYIILCTFLYFKKFPKWDKKATLEENCQCSSFSLSHTPSHTHRLTHIHTHTSTPTPIHRHTDIHIHKHIHTHTDTSTFTHTLTYTNTLTHTQRHTHTHTYRYTHTQIHTHTLAHTDIHAHLHTQGHHSLAVRFGVDHLTFPDLSCPLGVKIPHSPESRGWPQVVSGDAQVFSAVVSALLAFPGTEVTKLPEKPVPWVASSPATCHPHPRAATALLVPDGRQTLQKLRSEGHGGWGPREGSEADQTGANISPRAGGRQGGTGRTKDPGPAGV